MMLNKKISLILFTITIGLLPVIPTGINAQVSCKGTACVLLPLTPQEFDQMLWDFKFQYLDVLMDDMGKAAVLANMSGAPVGTVNLSGITFGAGVAAGLVEEHKVAVLVNGTGTMTDIPSGGASVIPRAHLGVNLGKFIGKSYDPFKNSTDSKPSMFSLARFDVYLSMMTYKYEKRAQVKFNMMNYSPVLEDSYKATSNYAGMDIYYHLMEGKGLAGYTFGFLGLSVGLGLHDALQTIEYINADSKAVINLNGGDQLVWQGTDMLSGSVRVHSKTAEIKTGIRFLYFFSLTGAVGSAVNSGKATMQYTRNGNIYLSSDIAAAMGLSIPDAWLTLNMITDRDVPKRTNYQKLGLELNFAAFKIAAEGIKVGDDVGGSVGLRFVF